MLASTPNARQSPTRTQITRTARLVICVVSRPGKTLARRANVSGERFESPYRFTAPPGTSRDRGNRRCNSRPSRGCFSVSRKEIAALLVVLNAHLTRARSRGRRMRQRQSARK
jgi:hypothetical protein